MAKIAFVFPGQGSQYVGMSREFIESDSETRKVLDEFRKKTDIDLEDIMLNGPEEKLKQTWYTQPAILFHSITALRFLEKNFSIKPDYVAGHSLGEFSALVANGCLNLQDALYLVHKRGEYMIKANDGRPFGMAAIIGLKPDLVKSICLEASEKGIVIAANFNTPVQTVISGTQEGVDRALEIAKEKGAKRLIPLVVGGAFHSPLVAKAENWLKTDMDKMTFNDVSIPVISNVDAKPCTSGDQIIKNLCKQVSSSVMWLDSVHYMLEQGVDLFIEFGPGKVLSGMLRKIDRKASSINIEKPEDIEKVKEIINNLS